MDFKPTSCKCAKIGVVLACVATLILAGCGGGGGGGGSSTTTNSTGSGSGVTAASPKAITSFSIASPTVTGTINESAKIISVSVPAGTNVTALVAKWSTSGASVKVGTVAQTSGTTSNDFTKPVIYTVTGLDASTTQYTVTVTVAAIATLAPPPLLPTISKISPTQGVAGSVVTITGTNFSPYLTGNKVYFDAIPSSVSGVGVIGWSGTVLAATTTSLLVQTSTGGYPTYGSAGQSGGPIPGAVIVVTSGGESGSSSTFTYEDPLAPTITSFTPTAQSVGAWVIISGTNFNRIANQNTVKFCNNAGTVSMVDIMGTTLYAVLPPNPAAMDCPISVQTIHGIATTVYPNYVGIIQPPATVITPVNPLTISTPTVWSAFNTVNVINKSNLNVTISAIAVSGAGFSLGYGNCSAASLATGGMCSQEVLFSPTAPGTYSGTLTVGNQSVSFSATSLPPPVVTAPAVALSTSLLNFGTQTPGTSSASQAVTLSNTGNATLNISQIGATGTYGGYLQTNNCGTSLGAGASCTINVSFSPAPLSSGPLSNIQNGWLSIWTNAATTPYGVDLRGNVNLGVTGQAVLYTTQAYGVQSVSVDNTWVGGNIKFGSQNTCGGLGAITVTLAPGTHTVTAYDPILSIPAGNVTVTAGGCTPYLITGTSSCLAPNTLLYGTCYPPAPPICTSPQVLQNGVCVTPSSGVLAGTGSGASTGASAGAFAGTGGSAGTFIGTGAGTGAAQCLSFGLLTGAAANYSDTQTITNTCSVPVYVMHCHTSTNLPSTSSTVCGTSYGGTPRFYQQFYWLKPGEVTSNSMTMPPGTTIWYAACSGGPTPNLPIGHVVDLAGSYTCD